MALNLLKPRPQVGVDYKPESNVSSDENTHETWRTPNSLKLHPVNWQSEIALAKPSQVTLHGLQLLEHAVHLRFNFYLPSWQWPMLPTISILG